MLKNLNGKCHILFGHDTIDKRRVLTNVYVTCRNVILQISIVYERDSFLWIGGDHNTQRWQSANVKVDRCFGDKARAISKFKLNKVVDDEAARNFYYIPSDLDQFLFDYDHSAFLECNRELAESTSKQMGAKYVNQDKRLSMIGQTIQYLGDTLSSFKKHYWLAGGTLLGWYRECDIIPHTSDVDFAIWSHEYDPKIKEYFLGNTAVRVWGTLGMVNDIDIIFYMCVHRVTNIKQDTNCICKSDKNTTQVRFGGQYRILKNPIH